MVVPDGRGRDARLATQLHLIGIFPAEKTMQRQAKAPAVRVIKALVAIGLLVGVFFVRTSAQTGAAGPFVDGDILVKFRPGSNAVAKADAHRTAGGNPSAEISRTGVQRVRVAPGQELAAIARYRRNPNVVYAERNVVRRIPMPVAHDAGSPVVPGDHYFDEQWALHNTGQSFYCIP